MGTGCRTVTLAISFAFAMPLQAADTFATRPTYVLVAPDQDTPGGFSSDSRRVYHTGTSTGRVGLFELDLVTGARRTVSPRAVSFSPESQLGAVSTGLTTVAVFDVPAGTFLPAAGPWVLPDGESIAGYVSGDLRNFGDPLGLRFPVVLSTQALVPAGQPFEQFAGVLDATTRPVRVRVCGARTPGSAARLQLVGYNATTNSLNLRVLQSTPQGIVFTVGTLDCSTDNPDRQPILGNFATEFPGRSNPLAPDGYVVYSEDARIGVTGQGHVVDRLTRAILFTPQQLGGGENMQVNYLAMTRDGRYMLVQLRRVQGTTISDLSVSMLDTAARRVAAFVLNKQQQPLVDFSGFGYFFSPDASKVQFVGGGVDFIDVPNSTARTVNVVACNPFLCDALPAAARTDAPVATKSVLSDDGRFVVFDSGRAGLAAGDTNGVADVFRLDRASGAVELVSRVPGGAGLPGGARGPSINSDGTLVAFDAPTTAAAGAPTDVVIHDLVAGQLRRLGELLGIDFAQTPLFDAALSGNGKFAAFASAASGLAPGDVDAGTDVYRIDLDTREVVLASGGADGDCARPALSRDGAVVAFECNGAPGAKGATTAVQALLYDHLQRKLELVSHGASDASEVANAASRLLGLSADGNTVLFSSGASNLVANDANAQPDLFAYRRDANGAVTRLSVAGDGGGIDGPVTGGALSGDGQAFAFTSTATNIDPLGTSGTQALYLGATAGGAIRQVRRGADGPASASAPIAALSYTGGDVVFNDAGPGGKADTGARLLASNNPAVGTDALTVSSQFAGLWYNLAQNGHGFLVELTESNGVPTVIVSWYVYLDGQQRWLFGSAPLRAGGASVPMFITRGTSFPPAFDPARVVLEPWGVLTLKFLAPNQGIFAWSSAYPGFGPGVLRVDRLSSVSERASDRAGEMPSCASGTWFDVARPGQGFQVQKLAGNPAQLVVIWYVYDQGQQFWLIGQGPIAGNQATVAMVSTRGGTFPPIFDPAAVQQSPWGSLTFRFVDANRARVDWAPTAAGFTGGGYDLARLSLLAARPCR